MYTVFSSDGAVKRDRIGLAVFVRTLQAARAACEPGDYVIGWGKSGSARARWTCGADGRVRKDASPSQSIRPARESDAAQSMIDQDRAGARLHLARIAAAAGRRERRLTRA